MSDKNFNQKARRRTLLQFGDYQRGYEMASVGSNACANVRGWDGLAMPAKDETGRVCHSPISPILARALQYFDEMPDSKDSGGNAEEYAEDEESLAEELQSACRCEPFRLPRGACPSRISLPQHSPPHLSHRPCSARIAPCGPDRTQTDGGGSRPGVAGAPGGDSSA
jgi:hypothetical protein